MNIKIILYDILLFLSIKSETPMVCSKKDIDSFLELVSQSNKQDFDLVRYVSWAYDYISKYSVKGHRLPVSYLLNDKIIEYCAKRSELSANNMIYSCIMDEVLVTEKECRRICNENSIPYAASIRLMLKEGLLPDSFLAFKFYNNSDICHILPTPDKYKELSDILEPIFIYYTAKNGIYNTKSLVKWNNSSIENWFFCPLMFRDQQLLKIIPEKYLKNEASTSGSNVHKICELLIDRYKEKRDKNTIEEVYAKFIKTKAYSNLADLIDEKEHLEGIRSFFHTKFKELVTPESEIHQEVLLELPFGEDLLFFGTPDFYIINEDHCYLLDWKTSKLTEKYIEKNNSKYHKQLSLYANMIMHKHPQVKTVTPMIIYTRGLIVDLKNPLPDILSDRSGEIKYIKKQIQNNMFRANTSSCFLCRNPDCSSRTKESIWKEDGTRK